MLWNNYSALNLLHYYHFLITDSTFYCNDTIAIIMKSVLTTQRISLLASRFFSTTFVVIVEHSLGWEINKKYLRCFECCFCHGLNHFSFLSNKVGRLATPTEILREGRKPYCYSFHSWQSLHGCKAPGFAKSHSEFSLFFLAGFVWMCLSQRTSRIHSAMATVVLSRGKPCPPSW